MSYDTLFSGDYMFEKYRNNKWVIGVSGGIDSMSLLDMAYKAGLSLVLCHVNYHCRGECSDYDQSKAINYAKEHNIPYYTKDVYEKVETRFEAWAREVRYEFYQAVVEKEGCKGLLLAHHADDFLETALLREHQGRRVSYYGIRDEGYVHGMLVVRPLLHMFKEDLIQYIEDNHIDYGQDYTNFETKVERNKIRNIELKGKTKEEKLTMIQYYYEKNKEIYEKECEYRNKLSTISSNNGIQLEEYLKCTKQEGIELLRIWLQQIDEEFYSISDRFLEDLDEFVRSERGKKKEVRNFLIIKEFKVLRCIVKEDYTYSYVLDSIRELETPYVNVKLEGTLKEGLTVTADDFPLTIRNVRDGDKIAFSFGHRNIKQHLVSQKIVYEVRQRWPIVENCRGEVIFVCDLGANIKHFTNKPNLFVVK